MSLSGFHRLHNLRMQNDDAGFAMEEQSDRFARIANRHTNGTAPRAVSAFQLFQTPPELAARLAALLDLSPAARVLEPSAGLGRLLDALRNLAPREVVAVETSPDCARELFTQNRAGVTIKQRDFLATTPEELGFFDAVAMNPPFHMRADIRHILHARSFLAPRGRLAALCLDTPQRAAALRSLASTWEQIPAGAFRSEGTNVPAILLSIHN